VTARRCVVVGDVVASRQVEDRESLRDVLTDGIERTNEDLAREHEDGLVAPFATLKGVDEVGGVLRTLAGSYRAVRTLVEAIHPAEIRFAVVWGEVDVGVGDPDVARQDGPAFHRADELLAELAESDRYVGLELQDGPATPARRPSEGTAGGGTDPCVRTIGNQMDLLCAWKAEWTERQTEVVRQYRGAETMAEVADRLGVTVQTVSKTLGRASAERILAIEDDLQVAVAHLAAEVAD